MRAMLGGCCGAGGSLGLRSRACSLCIALLAVPAGANAGSLYSGPGPRPGPDILYEPLADAPAAAERGRLAGAADPRLRRERLPRRRVPLPGLPLRRQRARRATRSRTTRASTGTRSRGRPAPTPIRRTPPSTRTTRPTSSSCGSSRSPARPPSASRSTRSRTPTRRRRRSRSAAPRACLWRGRTAPTSPRRRSFFLTVHGSTAELISRGQRPAGARAGAHRERRHDAAPDHRARSARPLEPDRPGGAGRGRDRPLEHEHAAPTSCPAHEPDCDAAGWRASRRTRPRSSTSLSGSTSRGRTVQSPNARHRPGMVARQRPGARARERATSASSSPTSTSPSSPPQRDDDMPGQPGGVPQTGPMNRILASHFETEQGVNYAVGCQNPTTDCKGWFRGQLQPYAIYVPNKPQPSGGYGLTLLLHSLGANYNQFADSANQSQFGERGAGLDRDHRGGARARCLVLRPRRRRRLRDVGRRGRPLPARPRVDRDRRLLDGRLRDLQVHDAVPRPVRKGAADGRPPGQGVWVAAAPTRSPAAHGPTRTGCSPRCATSRS